MNRFALLAVSLASLAALMPAALATTRRVPPTTASSTSPSAGTGTLSDLYAKALNGNEGAMYQLAQRYMNGSNGVSQDRMTALAWLILINNDSYDTSIYKYPSIKRDTTVEGNAIRTMGTLAGQMPLSDVLLSYSVAQELPLAATVPLLQQKIGISQAKVNSTSGYDQLSDARNAQRRSDVMAILNSVYQYSIDHNGSIPSGITTQSHEICRSDAKQCGTLLNLPLGTYITSLPVDPQQTATSQGTGYSIVKNANGYVTVSVNHAEGGVTISASR